MNEVLNSKKWFGSSTKFRLSEKYFGPVEFCKLRQRNNSIPSHAGIGSREGQRNSTFNNHKTFRRIGHNFSLYQGFNINTSGVYVHRIITLLQLT